MLAKAVKRLLGNVFDKYVEGDFDLQFSLFSKHSVTLDNLTLKHDAINELFIDTVPFKLTAAYLGSVKLDIPFTSIRSKPVKIFVSQILLVVETVLEGDWSKEKAFEFIAASIKTELMDLVLSSLHMENELLSKTDQLHRRFGDFSNFSFVNRAIARIIDNFQLILEDCNVRIEAPIINFDESHRLLEPTRESVNRSNNTKDDTDCTENFRLYHGGFMPYWDEETDEVSAVNIYFSSLCMFTTNQSWNREYVYDDDCIIYKVVELTDFKLMLESSTLPFSLAMKADGNVKEIFETYRLYCNGSQMRQNTLLNPLKVRIRAKLNSALSIGPGEPYHIDLQTSISPICFLVDLEKLAHLSQLAAHVSRHATWLSRQMAFRKRRGGILLRQRDDENDPYVEYQELCCNRAQALRRCHSETERWNELEKQANNNSVRFLESSLPVSFLQSAIEIAAKCSLTTNDCPHKAGMLSILRSQDDVFHFSHEAGPIVKATGWRLESIENEVSGDIDINLWKPLVSEIDSHEVNQEIERWDGLGPLVRASPDLSNDEIEVTFTDRDIGVVLDRGFQANTVAIISCVPGSQASRSQLLEPGMVITAIQGFSCVELGFEEVSERIIRASRPVTVRFKGSEASAAAAAKIVEGSKVNMLRAVTVVDGLDISFFRHQHCDYEHLPLFTLRLIGIAFGINALGAGAAIGVSERMKRIVDMKIEAGVLFSDALSFSGIKDQGRLFSSALHECYSSTNHIKNDDELWSTAKKEYLEITYDGSWDPFGEDDMIADSAKVGDVQTLMKNLKWGAHAFLKCAFMWASPILHMHSKVSSSPLRSSSVYSILESTLRSYETWKSNSLLTWQQCFANSKYGVVFEEEQFTPAMSIYYARTNSLLLHLNKCMENPFCVFAVQASQDSERVLGIHQQHRKSQPRHVKVSASISDLELTVPHAIIQELAAFFHTFTNKTYHYWGHSETILFPSLDDSLQDVFEDDNGDELSSIDTTDDTKSFCTALGNFDIRIKVGVFSAVLPSCDHTFMKDSKLNTPASQSPCQLSDGTVVKKVFALMGPLYLWSYSISPTTEYSRPDHSLFAGIKDHPNKSLFLDLGEVSVSVLTDLLKPVVPSVTESKNTRLGNRLSKSVESLAPLPSNSPDFEDEADQSQNTSEEPLAFNHQFLLSMRVRFIHACFLGMPRAAWPVRLSASLDPIHVEISEKCIWRMLQVEKICTRLLNIFDVEGSDDLQDFPRNPGSDLASWNVEKINSFPKMEFELLKRCALVLGYEQMMPNGDDLRRCLREVRIPDGLVAIELFETISDALGTTRAKILSYQVVSNWLEGLDLVSGIMGICGFFHGLGSLSGYQGMEEKTGEDENVRLQPSTAKRFRINNFQERLIFDKFCVQPLLLLKFATRNSFEDQNAPSLHVDDHKTWAFDIRIPVFSVSILDRIMIELNTVRIYTAFSEINQCARGKMTAKLVSVISMVPRFKRDEIVFSEIDDIFVEGQDLRHKPARKYSFRRRSQGPSVQNSLSITFGLAFSQEEAVKMFFSSHKDEITKNIRPISLDQAGAASCTLDNENSENKNTEDFLHVETLSNKSEFGDSCLHACQQVLQDFFKEVSSRSPILETVVHRANTHSTLVKNVPGGNFTSRLHSQKNLTSWAQSGSSGFDGNDVIEAGKSEIDKKRAAKLFQLLSAVNSSLSSAALDGTDDTASGLLSGEDVVKDILSRELEVFREVIETENNLFDCNELTTNPRVELDIYFHGLCFACNEDVYYLLEEAATKLGELYAYFFGLEDGVIENLETVSPTGLSGLRIGLNLKDMTLLIDSTYSNVDVSAFRSKTFERSDHYASTLAHSHDSRSTFESGSSHATANDKSIIVEIDYTLSIGYDVRQTCELLLAEMNSFTFNIFFEDDVLRGKPSSRYRKKYSQRLNFHSLLEPWGFGIEFSSSQNPNMSRQLVRTVNIETPPLRISICMNDFVALTQLYANMTRLIETMDFSQPREYSNSQSFSSHVSSTSDSDTKLFQKPGIFSNSLLSSNPGTGYNVEQNSTSATPNVQGLNEEESLSTSDTVENLPDSSSDRVALVLQPASICAWAFGNAIVVSKWNSYVVFLSIILRLGYLQEIEPGLFYAFTSLLGVLDWINEFYMEICLLGVHWRPLQCALSALFEDVKKSNKNNSADYAATGKSCDKKVLSETELPSADHQIQSAKIFNPKAIQHHTYDRVIFKLDRIICELFEEVRRAETTVESFVPKLRASVLPSDFCAESFSLFDKDYLLAAMINFEASFYNWRLGTWEAFLERFSGTKISLAYKDKLGVPSFVADFRAFSRLNFSLSEDLLALMLKMSQEVWDCMDRINQILQLLVTEENNRASEYIKRARNFMSFEESEHLHERSLSSIPRMVKNVAWDNSFGDLFVNNTGVNVIVRDLYQVGIHSPGTIFVDFKDGWNLPHREKWKPSAKLMLTLLPLSISGKKVTDNLESNQTIDSWNREPYAFTERSNVETSKRGASWKSFNEIDLLGKDGNLERRSRGRFVLDYPGITSDEVPKLLVEVKLEDGTYLHNTINLATYLLLPNSDCVEWFSLMGATQLEVTNAEILLGINFKPLDDHASGVYQSGEKYKFEPIHVASGATVALNFDKVPSTHWFGSVNREAAHGFVFRKGCSRHRSVAFDFADGMDFSQKKNPLLMIVSLDSTGEVMLSVSALASNYLKRNSTNVSAIDDVTVEAPYGRLAGLIKSPKPLIPWSVSSEEPFNFNISATFAKRDHLRGILFLESPLKISNTSGLPISVMICEMGMLGEPNMSQRFPTMRLVKPPNDGDSFFTSGNYLEDFGLGMSALFYTNQEDKWVDGGHRRHVLKNESLRFSDPKGSEIEPCANNQDFSPTHTMFSENDLPPGALEDLSDKILSSWIQWEFKEIREISMYCITPSKEKVSLPDHSKTGPSAIGLEINPSILGLDPMGWAFLGKRFTNPSSETTNKWEVLDRRRNIDFKNRSAHYFFVPVVDYFSCYRIVFDLGPPQESLSRYDNFTRAMDMDLASCGPQGTFPIGLSSVDLFEEDLNTNGTTAFTSSKNDSFRIDSENDVGDESPRKSLNESFRSRTSTNENNWKCNVCEDVNDNIYSVCQLCGNVHPTSSQPGESPSGDPLASDFKVLHEQRVKHAKQIRSRALYSSSNAYHGIEFDNLASSISKSEFDESSYLLSDRLRVAYGDKFKRHRKAFVRLFPNKITVEARWLHKTYIQFLLLATTDLSLNRRSLTIILQNKSSVVDVDYAGLESIKSVNRISIAFSRPSQMDPWVFKVNKLLTLKKKKKSEVIPKFTSTSKFVRTVPSGGFLYVPIKFIYSIHQWSLFVRPEREYDLPEVSWARVMDRIGSSMFNKSVITDLHCTPPFISQAPQYSHHDSEREYAQFFSFSAFCKESSLAINHATPLEVYRVREKSFEPRLTISISPWLVVQNLLPYKIDFQIIRSQSLSRNEKAALDLKALETSRESGIFSKEGIHEVPPGGEFSSHEVAKMDLIRFRIPELGTNWTDPQRVLLCQNMTKPNGSIIQKLEISCGISFNVDIEKDDRTSKRTEQHIVAQAIFERRRDPNGQLRILLFAPFWFYNYSDADILLRSNTEGNIKRGSGYSVLLSRNFEERLASNERNKILPLLGNVTTKSMEAAVMVPKSKKKSVTAMFGSNYGTDLSLPIQSGRIRMTSNRAKGDDQGNEDHLKDYFLSAWCNPFRIKVTSGTLSWRSFDVHLKVFSTSKSIRKEIGIEVDVGSSTSFSRSILVIFRCRYLLVNGFPGKMLKVTPTSRNNISFSNDSSSTLPVLKSSKSRAHKRKLLKMQSVQSGIGEQQLETVDEASPSIPLSSVDDTSNEVMESLLGRGVNKHLHHGEILIPFDSCSVTPFHFWIYGALTRRSKHFYITNCSGTGAALSSAGPAIDADTEGSHSILLRGLKGSSQGSQGAIRIRLSIRREGASTMITFGPDYFFDSVDPAAGIVTPIEPLRNPYYRIENDSEFFLMIWQNGLSRRHKNTVLSPFSSVDFAWDRITSNNEVRAKFLVKLDLSSDLIMPKGRDIEWEVGDMYPNVYQSVSKDAVFSIDDLKTFESMELTKMVRGFPMIIVVESFLTRTTKILKFMSSSSVEASRRTSVSVSSEKFDDNEHLAEHDSKLEIVRSYGKPGSETKQIFESDMFGEDETGKYKVCLRFRLLAGRLIEARKNYRVIVRCGGKSREFAAKVASDSFEIEATDTDEAEIEFLLDNKPQHLFIMVSEIESSMMTYSTILELDGNIWSEKPHGHWLTVNSTEWNVLTESIRTEKGRSKRRVENLLLNATKVGTNSIFNREESFGLLVFEELDKNQVLSLDSLSKSPNLETNQAASCVDDVRANAHDVGASENRSIFQFPNEGCRSPISRGKSATKIEQNSSVDTFMSRAADRGVGKDFSDDFAPALPFVILQPHMKKRRESVIVQSLSSSSGVSSAEKTASAVIQLRCTHERSIVSKARIEADSISEAQFSGEIFISSIGISLVYSRKRIEILYLISQRFSLAAEYSFGTICVSSTMGNFQIDCHDQTCKYNVVVSPEELVPISASLRKHPQYPTREYFETRRMLFRMNLIARKHRLMEVESFQIEVLPIMVNLEEKLLANVLQWLSHSDRVGSLATYQPIHPIVVNFEALAPDSADSEFILVHWFSIEPIEVIVEALLDGGKRIKAEDQVSVYLRRYIPTVRLSTRLKFHNFVKKNYFESSDEFLRLLWSHYNYEIRFRNARRLVSNTSVYSNPIPPFLRVVNGVSQVFVQPYEKVKIDGIGGVFEGCQIGASIALANVSSGVAEVLNSVLGIVSYAATNASASNYDIVSRPPVIISKACLSLTKTIPESSGRLIAELMELKVPVPIRTKRNFLRSGQVLYYGSGNLPFQEQLIRETEAAAVVRRFWGTSKIRRVTRRDYKLLGMLIEDKEMKLAERIRKAELEKNWGKRMLAQVKRSFNQFVHDFSNARHLQDDEE